MDGDDGVAKVVEEDQRPPMTAQNPSGGRKNSSLEKAFSFGPLLETAGFWYSVRPFP